MDELRKATLRVVAFAEAADMALTAFDVWQYLEDVRATLRDVLSMLDRLVSEGALLERWGYYTFPDRPELIEEHLARLQIASRKRRRAARWARRIVRLPFVRGVFAAGSLATGNTREGSDLDVLIVVRSGRIFLARFLVSVFTEMFGVRRSGQRIRDSLCLNHYVTEEALAVPQPHRNLPTAWLWARMYPLALRDPLLGDRFVGENAWVGEYFPNHQLVVRDRMSDEGAAVPVLLPMIRLPRFAQTIGDALERIARSLQLRQIERNPLTRKAGGRIVANDRMLIFNPELPEAQRLRRYHERLSRIGFDI